MSSILSSQGGVPLMENPAASTLYQPPRKAILTAICLHTRSVTCSNQVAATMEKPRELGFFVVLRYYFGRF